MKKDRVNVSVIQDPSRTKKNGRLPLKLRITYKGMRRYYSTGYDATLEEWNLLNSENAK